MKQKFLYSIVLIGVLLGSCKKKQYPESVFENEANYYFNGTVNGVDVSLQAGDNDYYMYAATTTNSDVTKYTANLRKNNCNSCGPSLLVSFNAYKAAPNGIKVDVDSTIKIRNYPIINVGSNLPFSVDFQSNYNKVASSYLWDFGDGFVSSLQNPNHVFKKQGIYRVCLTVTGTNGCRSTICSEQKIGLSNVCKTSIAATGNGKLLNFSQNSSGVGTLRYYWDFGDGFTSTLANPSHSYAIAGGYPVTLRVTDGNNDVAIASYNAIAQNDGSACAANYKIVNETIDYNDPEYLQLSGINIVWNDADGTVYTSNSTLQPADSFFEVLSIEEGDVNENSLKTKRIRLRFKTTLYAGVKTITVNNVNAVLAIAYR
jgi:PKD repeat protein